MSIVRIMQSCEAGGYIANFLLLFQYLGSLHCEHVVLKNDELTVAELRALEPRAILLSPGPGNKPLVILID